MTPTMEEVAGWLREAAGIFELSYQHGPGHDFWKRSQNRYEDRAAKVEEMAKFQLDAVTHLVEIGKDCERCGWGLDKVLWCTDSHNITVRKLLSLEGLKEPESMTHAAQVEAMGALKTCDTCRWWETNCEAEVQIGSAFDWCNHPDLRIENQGPAFGCVLYNDRKQPPAKK